jgi:hypothetical protein
MERASLHVLLFDPGGVGVIAICEDFARDDGIYAFLPLPSGGRAHNSDGWLRDKRAQITGKVPGEINKAVRNQLVHLHKLKKIMRPLC